MARSKKEVQALSALLEQDWPDAEELAKALIDELDTVRATGTTYVGVLQFGGHSPFYAGIGPYPGLKSARNALDGHPAAGDAIARAVIPLTTKEGLSALIENVDTIPEYEVRETAKSKKELAQKFNSMMRKERLHVRVHDASDIKIKKVKP